MQVFSRQIKTAHKLIDKYGQFVNLCQIQNTVDSDNPYLNLEQQLVKHKVKMCFMPTNRENLKSFQFLNDIEIVQGSVVAYFTSQTLIPSLKDYVERNGEILKILSVDEINPNGESCLYTLILKK